MTQSNRDRVSLIPAREQMQQQDLERALDDLEAGRVLTEAEFVKSLKQRIARIKKSTK